MCVLFFILNPNPSEDGYKLILANNRDEYYTRPTKIADFWEEEQNIISGLDMEPGKEGGTWLGMSKSGKIGVLLNILQPIGATERLKKGRGFLVTDFLKSNQTGSEYLESIAREGHDYNTFNLVTIEMKGNSESSTKVGHYTNTSMQPPVLLPSGQYGFGNSPPEIPWKKVVAGTSDFAEIISRHNKTDSKGELVQELFLLLNNETTMLPDPQLESQADGRGEEFASKLSALKVVLPGIKYGTRTNTIIIVDSRNKASYIERTMKEPVDAYNPEWTIKENVFQIE